MTDRIVRSAVYAAPDPAELDTSRRYLVPVARLDLPGEPDVVHLSLYQWLDHFEAWATGRALCGYSTTQGALPEGTPVTCARCLEHRPDYETYIAPGYRPEDDDPRALRDRVGAAQELLRTTLLVLSAAHDQLLDGHRFGALDDCPICDHARQIRGFVKGER
jgi:hypothetical protein